MELVQGHPGRGECGYQVGVGSRQGENSAALKDHLIYIQRLSQFHLIRKEKIEKHIVPEFFVK